MASPTFRITTLGCRVNHAEARDLASIMLQRGFREADGEEAADVNIVHTCSVTNAAARKSRHAVRRSNRQSSRRGVTFVTGCYAATDPQQAAELGVAIAHHDEAGSSMVERFAHEVDRWLRRAQPDRAADMKPIRSSGGRGSDERAPIALPTVPPRPGAARHLRAELKIQDGCDAHCTFCIIPKIRRTLRSKSIADAVAEASRLVDLGHPEIVLTGVFIGAYGHETALRRRQRDPRAEHLAELIDAVAAVGGLRRLRLSSMEPGDVTQQLLDAMVANAPTVVPHLHLPLQSGSDAILRRMNRQYRIGDYLDMIAMVNEALADGPGGLPPAITTDIICGFPGETEDDFRRTVDVARRVGFLHMHVFPYSPRAGTAAARWKADFVPDAEKKRRVRRLIDLEENPDDGLSIRYRRRMLGRTLRLILEQPEAGRGGWMTGRCDHYALIHVETDRPRGTLIDVVVTGVTAARTIGAVSRSMALPVLGDREGFSHAASCTH